MPGGGEKRMEFALEETPPVKSSIEELDEVLAPIDCASLRVRTSEHGSTLVLLGTVPGRGSEDQASPTRRTFFSNGQVAINVSIVRQALCRTLDNT